MIDRRWRGEPALDVGDDRDPGLAGQHCGRGGEAGALVAAGDDQRSLG